MRKVTIAGMEVEFNEEAELMPYFSKTDSTVYPELTLDNKVSLGSSLYISNGVKIGSYSYLGDYVSLGSGTKIGDFAYICRRASIERDVIIENEVEISENVRIGSNAVIGKGVFLPPGVEIDKGWKVVKSPVYFFSDQTGPCYLVEEESGKFHVFLNKKPVTLGRFSLTPEQQKIVDILFTYMEY